MNNWIVLQEENAVIIKNSNWDVTQDFVDSLLEWSKPKFQPYVWKKMNSLQISAWWQTYKVSWNDWEYKDLKFATPWVIKMVFVPYETLKNTWVVEIEEDKTKWNEVKK